ncbi:MAG: 4-amino-4-deoxy-L-arabinose transferase-like glycosyltransferase [Planctomycetota bacterium]
MKSRRPIVNQAKSDGQTTTLDPRGLSVVRTLVLIAAVAHVALFIYAVSGRLFYPFELEWMEGSCVDLVARIRAGSAIYGEPSLEFVPYLYAPFYFYISAAVSTLTGDGFLALRLISVLATAGCFELVRRWVSKQSHSSAAGFSAGAAFLACFAIGGAWLDLGRVDSLFLFLLLLASYLLRFGESQRSLILAAGIATLAILTKQTGLPVALALVGALAFRPRAMLVFGGCLLLFAGGATWLLDWLHDGWYWFFSYELPARHSIMTKDLLSFWWIDMLSTVPVLFALTLAFLYRLAKAKQFESLVFHGGLVGGMLIAAYLSRLHRGGYENVLLPAYLVLALHAGFQLAHSWSSTTLRNSLSTHVIRWGVSIAFILQLAALVYDASALIPTSEDRRAGYELVERIASVEGDVLIPSHGYLAAAAGKQTYAHLMAIEDLRRSGEEQIAHKLKLEINAALADHRFGALCLDDAFMVGTYAVKPSYKKAGEVFDDEHVFWPTTGRATRPKFFWVPNQ